MAVGGFVGSLDPVAIQLTWLTAGQVTVPDVVGALIQANLLGFGPAFDLIEETELDVGGIMGIEGEVDTIPIPKGAQWIRVARVYRHV